MDSTPPDNTQTHALVLGGGGSTGNAWLIGVVAGLYDAGVDVTAADLTIGTSAGSTAAAQLAGATPTDLFHAILEAAPPQAAGPGRGGAPVTDHLARTQAIIDAAADPADMRRRMGAAAVELDGASDGSWHARWRAIVASRLPSQSWPQQRLLITAVKAGSGEPVEFDRDSEIDLADAIAASCSGRIPYRIGSDLFIDGGYRRNENADLAAGYERVLVLSPFGGRSLHPPAWGMQLSAQVEELRAGGSRVLTIGPESEELFGANAMDLSLRPAAARTGHEQGRSMVEQVAALWG
jgi:NTE family protein